MQFKPVVGSAAIAAIALTVTHPLIAQAIPQKSRNACVQRTAEEMGVSVSDVRITNVGPVSAESGATTLLLENRKAGQTASCRVSTIDNTVLSVTLNNTGSTSIPNNAGSNAGRRPEYWVVITSRTFLNAFPGLFSKTVTNNVPRGTVLRNLGCQTQRTPTWCQVELRDNPQTKGWAWSPDLKAYEAEASTPTYSPNTTVQPGSPVPALADFVGARAGQSEQALIQRGYEWRNAKQVADSSFTYWLEKDTGNCVAIRTTEGRYGAIVYTADRDCNRR